MKKNYILIFFCSLSVSINAQWQHLKEPSGGSANCFAFSGNNIFAGSDGGVYLSTDNGANWTPVNNGLTGLQVHSLAIDGNNIFAGTWQSGMFLSTNNGASWTAINNGLTSPNITSIIINGSNIFAGTFGGGGVFLSTNNGGNWTSVSNGLTNTAVKSLIMNGSDIMAGTLGGGFISSNNGSSWTPMNNGLTTSWVNCFSISGTNIFAGTNSGVYLSTDGGGSWNVMNTGLTTSTSKTIYSFATNGSNIFAGTGQGVFLSNNNGSNWANVNNSMPNGGAIVAANGSNIFAAKSAIAPLTIGAIYLSTDNGNNWSSASHGFTSMWIYTLGTIGSSLLVSINTGLFMSVDGGDSSIAKNNGLVYPIKLLASEGSNAYAVNGYSSIFFSPDSGNSWTDVTNGMSDSSRVINSITTKGTSVLLGITGSDSILQTLIKTGGIFESTNNCASWSCLNNGFSNSNDSDVYSLAIVGNNIFAGITGGVLLSADNGNSWTEMNNGLSPYAVQSMVGRGNNIFATNINLKRSVDNGANWAIDTNGLGNNYIQSLCIGVNYILVGTQLGGVYLSTDSGDSWHAVNDGLGHVYSVHSLVVIGDTVYAGTSSNGVWKRSISELLIGINEHNNNIATITIFPNPAANELVVGSSEFGGKSKLTIYNILGEKVFIQQQTTNDKQQTVDVSQLPSGIYFVKIETEKEDIFGKFVKQ